MTGAERWTSPRLGDGHVVSRRPGGHHTGYRGGVLRGPAGTGAGGRPTGVEYSGGGYPGSPGTGGRHPDDRRRGRGYPGGPRSGREPATARSALRLRAVFAVFGVLIGLAVAVGCALLAQSTTHRVALLVFAALGAAWAASAVVDLVVIGRRRRAERTRQR